MKIAGNKNKCYKSKRITDVDGKVAQNAIEEKLVFRKHFADIQHGIVKPLADIIRHDRSRVHHRYDNIGQCCPLTVLSRAIPSLNDLISSYLASAIKKASGEACMGGAPFRFFAIEMAIMNYPIVVKSFMRISSPIQFRGGMLHELYKGKGQMDVVNNWRDVLLANEDTKGVLKLIRRKLMPHVSAMAADTQYGGGLNGGECAFAHLYIRLINDICVNMNLSNATLFFGRLQCFCNHASKNHFRV